MNFKRRLIFKSIFLLPLFKIGFKISNFFKRKKINKYIWILKNSD